MMFTKASVVLECNKNNHIARINVLFMVHLTAPANAVSEASSHVLGSRSIRFGCAQRFVKAEPEKLQ